MSKTRVVLNRAGVRSLLKSPEMRAILEARAQEIAGRADGKYRSYVAPTRAVAVVKGDNGNNSLLRSMR